MSAKFEGPIVGFSVDDLAKRMGMSVDKHHTKQAKENKMVEKTHEQKMADIETMSEMWQHVRQCFALVDRGLMDKKDVVLEVDASLQNVLDTDPDRVARSRVFEEYLSLLDRKLITTEEFFEMAKITPSASFKDDGPIVITPALIERVAEYGLPSTTGPVSEVVEVSSLDVHLSEHWQNHIMQSCSEALLFLGRDLSYANRSAAKDRLLKLFAAAKDNYTHEGE